MISTARAVREIAAAPAPVLLCDTCSLLDLIREPRDGFTRGHVEAALRLVARAEAKPRELWIVLTAQVLAELKDHRAIVQQEAEAAILKLEERVNGVCSIMLAHGVKIIAPTLATCGLPAIAQFFLQRYIDAATHTTAPRAAENRAFARIARNCAPAQKGQQAKDCFVLESYLALARELRTGGFGDPIVFFTTNTRDYSEPSRRGSLHATLVPEFNGLQLRYAVNFEMAEHQLK
ncbi:hypothetical protein ACRQ5Q_39455 [Bradyrhizobium sp. PMVTL-01]|uniref:hypothetical protein n=1 Tax=Bradyrhizobium sp. PMVTL-01 TaxID=3434999 RepID=UPI003F6EBD13